MFIQRVVIVILRFLSISTHLKPPLISQEKFSDDNRDQSAGYLVFFDASLILQFYQQFIIFPPRYIHILRRRAIFAIHQFFAHVLDIYQCRVCVLCKVKCKYSQFFIFRYQLPQYHMICMEIYDLKNKSSHSSLNICSCQHFRWKPAVCCCVIYFD